MTLSDFPAFPVLFDRVQIARRCHELARELRSCFSDEPPLLVAVIEGARPFARALQRALGGGVPIQEIRARSYSGTTSSGEVQVTPVGDGAALAVAGRDVVLLEDIVDTGRTVDALRRHFSALGARSVRVAALLSKPSRRVVEVEVEHVGFEIPDEFVLGFGMDLDGRYRELPDVVIYDRAVEDAFRTARALDAC